MIKRVATGIRIWITSPYLQKLFPHLHSEIVFLHGISIAMDVCDYLTDENIYSAQWTVSLLKTSNQQGKPVVNTERLSMVRLLARRILEMTMNIGKFNASKIQ